MRSRISVNIHGLNVRNKPKLINLLKQLQPTVVLVLDSLALAQEIKRELPTCTVIFRQFEHGKNIHIEFGAESWLDNHVSHSSGGIVIHVGNEMPFNTEAITWLLLVCKQAVRRGVTVCIGNWAVGNPEPDAWPKAKELLALASEHREHIIVGLHEYAGGVVTSGLHGGYPDNAGVQPGKPGGINLIQPESWPKDITAITCYHMGRYKFMLDYCKSIGIETPRIIITEAGFDDTSDIKPWLDKLKQTSPYLNITGYKSLINQWSDWFGARGWSTERVYAEQMIHADKYFYNEAAIEGRCIYSYGHSSAKWIPFDTEDADEFWDLIVRYSQEQSTPPLPPPMLTLFPADQDPRWESVTLTSLNRYAHVRKQPSTSSDSLRTFVLENVSFIPHELLRDDEQHHDQLPREGFGFWVPVKMQEIRGWVRSDAVIQGVLKSYKVNSPEPEGDDETPASDPPADNPTTTPKPTDAELLTLLKELVAAINHSSDVMERLAVALERQSEIESSYLVKPAMS